MATLAATTAFAQSSVQIVGTFDPSIANEKITYGDNKSQTQNFVRNNSQGTSQITFKGTEDLGGGLKASFLYENDFDARFDGYGAGSVNTGAVSSLSGGVKTGTTNFGSNGGEQFLALEGSAGKFQIGAPNTPTLNTQASRQPFGTKIGGGFGSAMGTGHVRNNNAMVYSTPMFSGFSAQLGYAFKTNADASPALAIPAVGDITDIAANYANGPFRAGLSFYSVGATVSGAIKNEQTNLYAQYDFAGATFYLGAQTEKAATSGNKSEGYNVAVKYALTPNVNLLANYGQLNDKSVSNLDKKVATIGAQYLLSKNTSLYARYVDQTTDNVALSATSTAKKVQTTLFGMQTNF